MVTQRVPTSYLDEKSRLLRRSVERLDEIDTTYQVEELYYIRQLAEVIVLEATKWGEYLDGGSWDV